MPFNTQALAAKIRQKTKELDQKAALEKAKWKGLEQERQKHQKVWWGQTYAYVHAYIHMSSLGRGWGFKSQF